MRNDPKIKTDGYAGFLAGIDCGVTPNSIKANQCAYAYNVTFRGGWADSRPGFMLRNLRFERDEAKTWFEDHWFQGAGTYKGDIVFSSGGRIFICDLSDNYLVREITPFLDTELTVAGPISPPIGTAITVVVTDATGVEVGLPVFMADGYYTVTGTTVTTITMTNEDATPGIALPIGMPIRYMDKNSANLPFSYILEVEDYCVIQDGQAAAIIYSTGIPARRANSSNHEVPTGTVMAYGRGRLWIAINDKQFVAGDINNGPTSVLQFTENIYLNGGGSFSVPSNAGPIRAMVFISDLDQSYGQGPLMVFTEQGVFSVNAPMERDQWQNVTNPIQTQTMIEHGALSHRGTILVNGDIFYRGRDGVRSLIFARRDFGAWGNSPVSGEMDGILKDDDETLLRWHSAVVFDNRMLFTVWPSPKDGAVYHNAIGSMDFRPLAGIGRQSPPIWEGIWGGIRTTQLVKVFADGSERCFAFALNSNDENQMWEITKNEPFENGFGRIESYVDTRSMIFGSGFESKRLSGLELWYDSLRGKVDFEVKYRPDQYPCWHDWKTWDECQTARDCGAADGSCAPVEYKPGYRPRVTIPQPVSVCDTNGNKPSDTGYEFQVRLKWTGKARIKLIMAKAREIEESSSGNMVC